VLDNPNDEATILRVKAQVKTLTDKYPVYAA
jgi:glycine hydroxymethyltransferase